MSHPLVSVIIPAYNAERFIESALRSILAQDYPNLECFVIDDGSKDSTAHILSTLAQKHPLLRFKSRANKGLVPSLNELLSDARGTYVARMDADDLAHPQRLSKQIAWMETHPDCVGLGTAVEMITSEGWRIKTYSPPASSEEIQKELLNGNGGALVHPTVIMRSTALKTAGGYSDSFSGYGEDWDLYTRLLALGQLNNLTEPLLGYRQHPASYNHSRTPKQVAHLQQRIDAFRKNHGLPPREQSSPAKAPSPQTVLYQWVTWAIEGGELGTAMKLIHRSLLKRPFDMDVWKLYRYVRTLQRSQNAHNSPASWLR